MPKKIRRSANIRGKAVGATPTSSEFNPDYTHVKRDLVRIGVLAGSFFAILIILSFFLQ